MRLTALKIVLPVVMVFTTPIWAEGKANFADCSSSNGCTCVVAQVDLAEYQVVTGLTPPEGAENMTLVSYNNDLIWSTSSFEELDLIAGGDGICEAQVFSITPEDGTWKGSVRTQNIQGCLPQVAEMVPPMVEAMGSVRQIAWGGKFHPARFAGGLSQSNIRWTERNPTYFEGVIPIQPKGPLAVSITTTATLTALDRAEATLSLRIAAADGANAGALAMLGMADCRVDAVYDFERVGP